MRDVVTTALDVLGLLLVAAGAAGAAALLVGPVPSLGAAGIVILGVSWWWARPPKRKGER